ncbi:MAG: 4Fe-4S cluster-binding domain-containing protein [Oscillospiraceae bacterium]|nr:4Fe-4S cluster-binding domain-containing protein [Oscillospiraceae bacterium]
MEQIIDACSTTLGILGKPKSSGGGSRLASYCVSLQTEDGVLLFNVLTREMLLLTFAEFDAALSSAYLQERWFTISEDQSEKELAELVHWVRASRRREPKHITKYTILTTTDCNARCFYCYERGCARVTMQPETADKVVGYIQNHCGGNKVKLRWFGGEPLMNFPVIDRICDGLRSRGIGFESHMISNGYLFDDELVAKASHSWELKEVQVTLDGTEAVYNRSKAFIYRDGSPYRIVTGNILRLLNAGISVVVRLNMDLNNADNLMELAKELAERFSEQKQLHVYAHLLFDTEGAGEKRYAPSQWSQLYEALHRLEDFLSDHGLSAARFRGLRRELPLSHCMADSGNSVVIVPDGHLGLCEHYTDREFFGHIDSDEQDKDMVASWRERCDPVAECGDCFYYPECTELKKCTARMECSGHVRFALRRDTERAMQNEYRRWRMEKAADQSKNE